MINFPRIPLNDSNIFQIVSGLWKGSHAPLKRCAVLRSTNFRSDGLINYSDIAELDVEERHFSQRQLLSGDIIIERSGGGPKQPVGRIGFFSPPSPKDFCTSNFTSIIRIKNHSILHPHFVSFYLHYLYVIGETEKLQRATTGIRNLDWNEYLKFEIPCLPFNEQNSISTILHKSRLLYLIEEKQIANLHKLKTDTMQTLFVQGLRNHRQKETEFGLVPENWYMKALSECADIQTGVAKGRKFANDELVQIPYLRVANVQDGHLDLKEIKTIEVRKFEIEKYRLRYGDVVLTEGGDFDKLGRGSIWRDELELCLHQNHIFAIRTHSNLVLPEFFAYLAQSPYGKAYFLRVAHKTTNLACINTTKLKAFPVIVPPIDEQQEIIEILISIDKKIDIHTKKQAVLEDLFKTLLHKLMTGEIRVNELDLSVLERSVDIVGASA